MTDRQKDASPSIDVAAADNFSFGPFLLMPGERRLLRQGHPVRLGGRAMDVLVALCGRAGSVVTKDELLQIVWPFQQVDEGSLRVHISELRKVLGEGSAGTRYIVNIPGTGYCFVAGAEIAVGASATPPYTEPASAVEEAPASHQRPPLLLARPIGREAEIEKIRNELAATGFVSVVGTGGVGKTTVALAVAQLLHSEVEASVFVDLAPVTDVGLVQAAFATALGIPVRDEHEITSIVRAIGDRKLLLLVDNCEHVVEPAAEVLQRINSIAPEVMILTTTREPLHVSGERVHRLPPLSVPPDVTANIEELRQFGAVALFTERAKALDGDFDLNEQNCAAVADICRNLDGLALAIEFAASRVAVLGTEALAGYFGRQLDMLDKGNRTASPRHQTLRLTLDWSYDLLSIEERATINRLSVFAGSFSLAAAQKVLEHSGPVGSVVANCLADLVDKSLVSLDTSSDLMRFRLLNTTREYVAERIGDTDDLYSIKRQHAGFFLDLLRDRIAEKPDEPLVSMRPELENVRAALVWAYSPSGDMEVAIPLTKAAVPFFWDLALLTECAQWSTKALSVLPDSLRGTEDELQIRVNSSLSLLFTKGNFVEVSAEIGETLRLAKILENVDVKEHVLSGLFAFHLRGGDVAKMTATALDAVALAKRRGQEFNGKSDSMMSMAHAFAGDINAALPLAERSLASLPVIRPISFLRTGVDHRMWSANVLSQVLWMRGEFDRSRAFVTDAIKEARANGHPVLEAIGLAWMIPVSFWSGDIELARERIARLADCAARGALLPFRLAAEGHRGTLQVLEGRVDDGIDALEGAVAKLKRFNSRMLQFVFTGYLADAYAQAGKLRLARQTIDDALALGATNGTDLYKADLLRRSAMLLWRETGCTDEVTARFETALALARSRSNSTFELRVLSDMVEVGATPSVDYFRRVDALASALSTFEGKGEAPDVSRARALLDTAKTFAEIDA